jgi:hypothetical protein
MASRQMMQSSVSGGSSVASVVGFSAISCLSGNSKTARFSGREFWTVEGVCQASGSRKKMSDDEDNVFDEEENEDEDEEGQ